MSFAGFWYSITYLGVRVWVAEAVGASHGFSTLCKHLWVWHCKGKPRRQEKAALIKGRTRDIAGAQLEGMRGATSKEKERNMNRGGIMSEQERKKESDRDVCQV